MSNETLEALMKVRDSITEILGAMVVEEVNESCALLVMQDEARDLYDAICLSPYLMRKRPDLLERLRKVGGVAP